MNKEQIKRLPRNFSGNVQETTADAIASNGMQTKDLQRQALVNTEKATARAKPGFRDATRSSDRFPRTY
jgi:hypothetical protein